MQHLRNTRLQIEKFVYAKGTNVALYNAERSKRYSNFQKALQRALYGQIKGIANYKGSLPLLVSLAKAKTTTAELLSQISILVSKDPLGKRVNLEAYLVWAGEQGGQAFLDKNGFEGTFGLKDEELVNYFDDYSQLLIDSVDDYTKEWIALKIQEGKDLGLTPFEIQELLEDDGLAITSIRAERIVLTETARAMSTIELEAAKRNGLKEKIWRTSLDERVCPTCGPLEGERKLLNENFSIGVDAPPAHVSCRCYFEDVIPEKFTMPEKVWVGQ